MMLYRDRTFQGPMLQFDTANSNFTFSPRTEGGAWTLCERPFFGGTCARVDGETGNLAPPRAFRNTTRSARPAASAAPEMPAAQPARPDEKPAVEPAPEP
jgi:hypothetical protein